MDPNFALSARRIFQAALDQGTAGELLSCLYDGGSATVDHAGRLVLVSASLLAQMGGTRPDRYAEITAERERAHRKHGSTSMESCDPLADRRLRVLVEEVGEVARVLNDAEHIVLGRADEESERALVPIRLREELVQVAAMAVAWIAALDGEALP